MFEHTEIFAQFGERLRYKRQPQGIKSKEKLKTLYKAHHSIFHDSVVNSVHIVTIM